MVALPLVCRASSRAGDTTRRTTVSALTFRNGVLANNWVYDSVTSSPNGGGDHSEMAADTDGDGGQEIITGPLTIDSAGTLKCNSGMGHGDAMDVGELVPGKGISVFSIHEALGGMDAHDGATCKSYFAITNPGADTGRGRAEYVGAGDENSASCTATGVNSVLCADGTTSAPSAGNNFVIYWTPMNGVSLKTPTGSPRPVAEPC